MADPIKADACSIDASGGSLVIRLVYTAPGDTVPQQIEYTYDGADAVRFAKEMQRQHALGIDRAAAVRLDKSGAMAVEAPVTADAPVDSAPVTAEGV